jgi:DNA-binding NtrC family response regulator
MSQILIVSADNRHLAAMLDVFDTAGYETAGASTFEDARRALARHSPDLIIADERLGNFNGLHVIMTARAERPGVSAIVTTKSGNRGLEADARSLDVACMVTPDDPAEWLEPISRMLPVGRVS